MLQILSAQAIEGSGAFLAGRDDSWPYCSTTFICCSFIRPP
jgi:hypothetical protein